MGKPKWTAVPLPLGVVSVDTTFSDRPGAISCDKMRPWQGAWQVIGGWQKIVNDTLTGVCRGAFGWTDYSRRQSLVFGTSEKLQVLRGGALTDITPLRPNETLTDPFTTTNGSAVVDVIHFDHQLTTGDTVTFSGASASGGITVNGAYTVTVTGDNTYTITHGGAASSDTTGGGTVTAAVNLPLKTGRVNGAGGAGFGAGSYGAGGYGQSSLGSLDPRTWSFGVSGETPYCCPRSSTIFQWDNNTSNRATRLTNCPDRVEYMLVAPTGQVMALGCTNEDGDFDPLCIRVSDGVDRTDWTTGTADNARQYVLAGSGYIIGARVVGPHVVAWTDNAIYWGRYTGTVDGWIFDLVADHRGLIGPLAACVFDSVVYWVGPDKRFYAYVIGGAPVQLDCAVQDQLDAITESQRAKIVLSTLTTFNEVWAFIPGAGLEIDRAISFNHTADPALLLWATHDLARTWFMDTGPTRQPVGVDYDGAVYYHEIGHSDNGNAFAWSVRTKAFYLAEGQYRVFVSGCRPDLQDQQGAVSLTFYVRETPQGAVTQTLGPYTLMVGDELEEFFFEGRLIELELSGEATPTDCRTGKLTFEMQPAGEY